MKSATIVGAGLVGSLWAVYLSKAGYKVTVVERRSDIRKAEISAGKSINLALSDRGWKALDTVGIGDEIREIAIPMHGRIMHDIEGNLNSQPYGKEGQAIYSVSRGELNARMMTIAENAGNAKIIYNEKCENVDLGNGIVYLKNTITGAQSEIKSDLVFATDGAFSAVRYNAMQKLDRFNFSQEYIEDGYREILLPANELHIWPRGRFMLIALPNEDGSFTCTLFMPFEGHKNSFENLKTRDQVDHFFKTTFPDFFELMPNVADAWEDHPLSSLALVRCFPWSHGKTTLMGDAAHATVPFFGQGMNCGFEDCTVMWDMMQKHGEDWDAIFKAYETSRKPNCDSMQNLSLHNYHVMRDHVADPKFLLQKKLERKMQDFYPDDYMPLYSMVTFSDVDYAEAEKKGEEQNKRIKKIMNLYDIEALFENGEIDDLIHQFYIQLTEV
jgi:kynurenine 3-monooxygenase